MDGSVFSARNKPVHPPTFTTLQEYVLYSNDTSFWMPYIADILKRHDLFEADQELVAGIGGIIDWGDMMVTDRHYEFAKLHLDLFDCDKTLLKAFLEASHWPVTTDFAHKAMAQALYRQAHGLTQHYAMDVFYMLPDRLPLQDIRTLEELANELFAI